MIDHSKPVLTPAVMGKVNNNQNISRQTHDISPPVTVKTSHGYKRPLKISNVLDI